MTAQASLFGKTEVPGGGHSPAPRTAKPRRNGMVRKPEVPFGKPDRSGKYWYERFHADLQKLPEDAREQVLEMVLFWPYDRMDATRKMLDRYCKAHVREQDNFHEAMGR